MIEKEIEKRDRYLNPFTDFGFKKLFGSEPNKDLLIDFLNEVIKEEGIITDVSYLKNDFLGRSKEDRNAVFDIYCENEKGEKFIVEMQKARQNYFKDRSVFYSTFPIQNQAQKGKWDYKLKAVYTIGVLDFIFEEDKDSSEYYHHEVKLMDTKRKKVFFDKLTFIYLEMPKFIKTENELETHFEKWMYLLKNMPDLQEIPPKLQERIFKKLLQESEIANLTQKDRLAYEGSLKSYRDMQNVIDTGREEGRVEGRAEGRAEGRVEGRAEGRAEGLTEALKKLVNSGISEAEARKILGL